MFWWCTIIGLAWASPFAEPKQLRSVCIPETFRNVCGLKKLHMTFHQHGGELILLFGWTVSLSILLSCCCGSNTPKWTSNTSQNTWSICSFALRRVYLKARHWAVKQRNPPHTSERTAPTTNHLSHTFQYFHWQGQHLRLSRGQINKSVTLLLSVTNNANEIGIIILFWLFKSNSKSHKAR